MTNSKMSKDQALKVLEINENDPSKETVIKQYRTLALRYHPDKPTGSTELFHRLTEAYDYLRQPNCEDSISLKSFASYIFENHKSNKIILNIIEKIISFCEEKSLSLLEKIDLDILHKIHEIINLHRTVFTISDHFLETVEQLIRRRTESSIGEHIILHPFLEDLFLDHLYKMTIDESVFIIPLWHHQLIYDHPTIKDSEIIVDCVPLLAENITIDSHNNIHCFVIKGLYSVFHAGSFSVDIGGRNFVVMSNKLLLIRDQEYIIHNEGIARINTGDIYDCRKKSDIHIHIHFT